MFSQSACFLVVKQKQCMKSQMSSAYATTISERLLQTVYP